MTTFRMLTTYVVLLMFSPLCWAQFDDNFFSSFESSRPYHSTASRSPYNLIIPTMVVHGFSPGTTLSSDMPRKMDANGDTVMTPGVGIEYKGSSHLQFLAAFIKDCYDDPAGTLQIGSYYKINKFMDWAWSLGVYARQTPYSCDVTRYGKSCYVTDGFDFKYMTKLNGYDVDIIPLPFLHFTGLLYKDSNFEVRFKFMGNFLLNEIGLEIPI
jgi:hypothetical protein